MLTLGDHYLAIYRGGQASIAAEDVAQAARQRITREDLGISLVGCAQAFQEEVAPKGSVQPKSMEMLDFG